MGTIIDDTTGRVIETADGQDAIPQHLTKKAPMNFLMVQEDFRLIFERMMGDQELLKLLYYSEPDALERDDITDNEDLEKITKNCINMIPDLSVPDKEVSNITVMMDGFTKNYTNPFYMDSYITFDILCPLKVWTMDNYQMRPYRILHRLMELFSDKKMNGIGKLEFSIAKSLTVGDFSGFILIFNVVNEF